MQVTIDPGSGFCFGVRRAVETAERTLQVQPVLSCLGDIVHNDREVARLQELGLSAISHEELESLSNTTVMIRAHGEPPETYRRAGVQNIHLIDATCPIVLRLQEKVRAAAEEMEAKNGQVVIFGKEGHAEVVALCGHAGQRAIVIGGPDDLSRIDFKRPVRLFSQTTMPRERFHSITAQIRQLTEAAQGDASDFVSRDTVCSQVANRADALKAFSSMFDVVVFVSGRKSSNGLVLFEACRSANPRSHRISDAAELDPAWFVDAETAGVCGATSTPSWLMAEVAKKIGDYHG